jgi:hypothetical protein
LPTRFARRRPGSPWAAFSMPGPCERYSAAATAPPTPNRFDEGGDLISYWECSLDVDGKELMGGGIGQSDAQDQ